MAQSKGIPETGLKEPSDMVGFQVAAAASGFMLSGTMLGMLVTMPVILDTSTDGLQLCRQWARAFDYGHVIGPVLCGATTLLHSYAALGRRAPSSEKPSKSSSWQLMAGAATLGMVPFTVVAMSSTNSALFDLLAEASPDLGSVKELVSTWSWLHFVRCMFPFTGAILGVKVFL